MEARIQWSIHYPTPMRVIYDGRPYRVVGITPAGDLVLAERVIVKRDDPKLDMEAHDDAP